MKVMQKKGFFWRIWREAHPAETAKQRRRLQHIRMSRLDWWTVVLLVLLMLVMMAMGAYLGQIFNGRMIEARTKSVPVLPRHVAAERERHAID